MPFYYTVYGLALECDVAIPHLEPSSPSGEQVTVAAPVDVTVSLGDPPAWFRRPLTLPAELWHESPYQDQAGHPLLRVYQAQIAGEVYYHFVYLSGNEFLVSTTGNQVWRVASASADPAQAAAYLLGPLIGFMLRLRAIPCLHASAVALHQGAVAFLGPPHAGKSTTVAAFAQAGYPILSDDIVTLVALDGQFMVYPGYPGLRLWPDTAAALFGPAADLPRLVPGEEKRYLPLRAAERLYSTQPSPLAAVYLLGERSAAAATPTIAPVTGHATLMALVTNSALSYLLDSPMRQQEFRIFSQVAAHVPVRRLTAPADLAGLGALVQAILLDVSL